VWATSGVHPLHSDEEADWDAMLETAADARCVALGELGLDRHYSEPAIDVQLAALETQLELIERHRLSKPIVVHCRDAFDDLLARFKASGIAGDRFVFHCFTGGPAEAQRVLDLGAMISFTGIVTFKNAAAIQAAAKLVPGDRIMIETDAPFLTPEPHRKVHPNEPCYAMDTARFVARLRGTAWEDFHATINANTTRFFGIEAR
jgi:TatD DNase family protein